MSDEEDESISEGFSPSEDEWKPGKSGGKHDDGESSDDDDSDFEESIIAGAGSTKSQAASRKRETKSLPKGTAGGIAKKRKPMGQSLRSRLYNKYRPPPKTLQSVNSVAGSDTQRASTSHTASKNAQTPNEVSGCGDEDENGSSSDSSVGNHLVKPADLDLRSSFFNIDGKENAAEATSAPPVFDCNAGIEYLSDSESEKQNEASDDEVKNSKAFDFRKLLENANSLERMKEQIAKNTKKSTAESSKGKDAVMDDVTTLLALGENQNLKKNDLGTDEDDDEDDDADEDARLPSKLNKTKSTRMKKHTKTRPISTVAPSGGAGGESDDSDFEEVADDAHEKDDTQTQDGLEIIVEQGTRKRSKEEKTQDELEMAFRRRLNRDLKDQQLLLHKASLLWFFGRSYHFNRLLNDTGLMQAALKILPGAKAYPRETGTELKYFQSLVTWFKTVIKLISPNSYPENEKVAKSSTEVKDELIAQIKRKEARCKQDLVLIFITLLRGMGLQCRLIVNMQPLPLKPNPKDLLPIKLKPDNKKDNEKDVDKMKDIKKSHTTNDKEHNYDKIKNNKETKRTKKLTKNETKNESKDIGKHEDAKHNKHEAVEKKNDKEKNTKATKAKKESKFSSQMLQRNRSAIAADGSPVEDCGSSKKLETANEEINIQLEKPKLKTDKTKSEKSSRNKVDLTRLKRVNNEKSDEASTSKNPSTIAAQTADDSPVKDCSSSKKVETANEEINIQLEKPKLKTDKSKSEKSSRNKIDLTRLKRVNNEISGEASTSKNPSTIAAQTADDSPVKDCSSSKKIETANEEINIQLEKPKLKTDKTKSEKSSSRNKIDLTRLKRVNNEKSGEASTSKKAKNDGNNALNTSTSVPKVIITEQSSTTKNIENETMHASSNGKTRKTSANVCPTLTRDTRSRSRSISPRPLISTEFLQTDAYKEKFSPDPKDMQKNKDKLAKKKQKAVKPKISTDFLKSAQPSTSRVLRSRQNLAQNATDTATAEKDKLTIPQLDGADDDIHNEKNKRKKNRTAQQKLQKSCSKSGDSDEDFHPSPPKQPKRAPVLPKAVTQLRKDRRVLSTDNDTDDDSKSSMKSKKETAADIWAEVWSDVENEWICVDLIKGKLNSVESIRKSASSNLAYVFAFQNDLSLKDVTARYCQHWSSVMRKERVPKAWLETAISPYYGLRTERDIREDHELRRIHEEKDMPKSIAEFKDHPLYALERHLLKFQAIYPPNAPTFGFTSRGDPIYSRDCVHVLHSREIWLKQARTVKLGEKPYKIVTSRPKWDRLTQSVIKDLPLEIFGHWQTEDYEPPTAENGIVPRNAYGNVELFKECMLPKKTVHIRLPGLNRICKKLGVDCANAVIGFDFHQGACHPTFDGFVVCEEFVDQVTAAWYQDQEEQDRKKQEKYEARVYGNWKKLIRGLLIRERLKKKYNF